MVEVTVKAEAEMTVTGADVDALVTAAQEKGVLGGPFPVLKRTDDAVSFKTMVILMYLSVGFRPPQKRLARAEKLLAHWGVVRDERAKATVLGVFDGDQRGGVSFQPIHLPVDVVKAEPVRLGTEHELPRIADYPRW